MTQETPKQLRMLAPDSFREKLSRRAFIQGGTALAGFALVAAACGKSDGGTADESTEGLASGDWSRVINMSSGSLAMYTWGDYNDPELVGAQAEAALGVTMKVDYYGSNEDLITKLATGAGASGFDIVVPTGPYIPQMLDKGLLQKLDKSLLPNMVNVDPLHLGKDWDPQNDYSVCKDWGSTGFFYDSSKFDKELTTWQDFLDACMGAGSGNCSVIDTADNYAAMWLWAQGKSWNTEDAADLAACEAFMVGEFAQHVKAFDSYPSTKLAEGAYIISEIWNGDARQAFVRIAEAGGTPENWKWVLGAPITELWMDNYAIPVGAPNVEAAHAWINWLLVPEISIQDMNYHGYNPGLKSMDTLVADLLPDLVNADMIFFSDDQVKAMEVKIINSNADVFVDILAKAKANAAG